MFHWPASRNVSDTGFILLCGASYGFDHKTYASRLTGIVDCPECLKLLTPSAIKIVSGKYEMGIGNGPEIEYAKIILEAGSYYEMLNPYGWHYVKPLLEPVLSIMITGKPFESQVWEESGIETTHR